MVAAACSQFEPWTQEQRIKTQSLCEPLNRGSATFQGSFVGFHSSSDEPLVPGHGPYTLNLIFPERGNSSSVPRAVNDASPVPEH